MHISELLAKPLNELRKMGEELGIPDAKRKKKEYLTVAIASRTHGEEGLEKGGGILEIMPEGIGFLREDYPWAERHLRLQAQLRRFDLRNGDMVFGEIRPPRESKTLRLVKVESVNGVDPEECATASNLKT